MNDDDVRDLFAHIQFMWCEDDRRVGVRVFDLETQTSFEFYSVPLPEGTPLRGVCEAALDRLDALGYTHGGDREAALAYCEVAYTMLGLPWEGDDVTEDEELKGRLWS